MRLDILWVLSLASVVGCTPQTIAGTTPPAPQSTELPGTSDAQRPPEQTDGSGVASPQPTPAGNVIEKWNNLSGAFALGCPLENGTVFEVTSAYRAANAALISQLIAQDSAWDEVAIRAQLTSLGFDNFSFVRSEAKGVFAYIARHDKLVLVRFRGTSDLMGTISDFKFATIRGDGRDATGLIRFAEDLGFQGMLHQGFYEAYAAVSRGFEEQLAANTEQKRPILFVGHSLGGALSNLAAVRAAKNNEQVLALYTFGAPRVGNSAFVASTEGVLGNKHYRLTRGIDIVPHVPPAASSAAEFEHASPLFQNVKGVLGTAVAIFDYTHGGLHISASDGTQSLSHLDRTQDLAYWSLVKEKRAADPLFAQALGANHPLVQDHSALKYACDLKNAK